MILVESTNPYSLLFKNSLELRTLIELRDSPDCTNDHLSLSRINSRFLCSGLRSGFTNVGIFSSLDLASTRETSYDRTNLTKLVLVYTFSVLVKEKDNRTLVNHFDGVRGTNYTPAR